MCTFEGLVLLVVGRLMLCQFLRGGEGSIAHIACEQSIALLMQIQKVCEYTLKQTKIIFEFITQRFLKYLFKNIFSAQCF